MIGQFQVIAFTVTRFRSTRVSPLWGTQPHVFDSFVTDLDRLLHIKAHYNIVETRPSNVNCGNINAIAMGPTHA